MGASGASTVAAAQSAPQRYAPWIAAAVGALCYLNTLGNGFTYDDNPIIVNNPRVQQLGNLREIWLRDWWYSGGSGEVDLDPGRDRLYRPLVFFTFALQYAVHGMHAAPFHAVNIGLHALACGLVVLLARRLTLDSSAALAAGLLFAVHPVHVEAVAGIVGRAEIVATIFLLAGLLFATAPRGGGHFAATAFLAALLSKETAICYVALVPLLWLWMTRTGQPVANLSSPTVAVLLLPLLIYFPLRYVALEQQFIRDKLAGMLFNPLTVADTPARILGVFTVLGHYARLLFFPRTLSSDYGLAIIDHREPFDAMTAVGFVTAAGLAWLAWSGVRALAGKGTTPSLAKLSGVLTLAFLASYALISNTVLLIGVSAAERLMYFPSVFFCVLIGSAAVTLFRRLVAAAPERAGPARLIGLLLLVGLAGRSVARNFDWYNDFTLFSADVETYPRAAYLSSSLARVCVEFAEQSSAAKDREAFLANADRLVDRALNVLPRFPTPVRTRGVIARMRGDTAKARESLETALQLSPEDRIARRELARLSGGDQQSAVRELRAQLEADPQNAALRRRLADALTAGGFNRDALAEFESLAAAAPDDVATLRGLAEALLVNAERRRATDVLRRVLVRDPSDWESHVNLSACLAEREPAESLTHATRARYLKPDDVRVRLAYAEALVVNARVNEAIAEMETVLKGMTRDHPFRAAVADRLQELRRERR
jgi:protein O-mannosyl-transferase